MSRHTVTINRAPVLTLWAAVVAERLGFRRDEALTLGRAVAGLTAQSKGRRLGIFKPGVDKGKKPRGQSRGEQFWVELCGRGIPAVETAGGVRAVVKDKEVDPEAVERYLARKFGEDLEEVRDAMTVLAESLEAPDLADRAFRLYEEFRPDVPAGKRGWGAVGELDLDEIRSME
jgi:hypothetical protein